MIVRTEGQYSLVQLEQARLFSSLLHGTQAKLVSIQFSSLKEKKHTVKDRFCLLIRKKVTLQEIAHESISLVRLRN